LPLGRDWLGRDDVANGLAKPSGVVALDRETGG
jgi:hypothetical protein